MTNLNPQNLNGEVFHTWISIEMNFHLWKYGEHCKWDHSFRFT